MTHIWRESSIATNRQDILEFEAKLSTKFHRQFGLAADIDGMCHLLRTSLVARHQTDYDPGSLPHNALFVRAWRLWQAVVILARQGHALEAMVLARSIWETRVHVGYLCADFMKRTRQFREYFELYGLAQCVRIATESPERYQDLNIDPPDRSLIASRIQRFVHEFAAEEQQAKYDRTARTDFDVIARFLREKNWMLMDVKSAAASFGATDEYEVFYPPTSRAVHGGYEGLVGFTWHRGDKTIVEAGPSVKGIQHVLTTAGIFILAVVAEINILMDFHFDEQLRTLDNRLLHEIHNPEAAS